MDKVSEAILNIIRDSHLATGADFSVYNVQVDFDRAEYAHALEVMDYAMVRGSSGRADGTVYVDPKIHVYYEELVEHPYVVRDVYHYLSSHSSWVKQYDTFMKAVDGKDFDIYTLDGERIYNVKSAKFAGYAYYFLKQLIKDFPDRRVKFYSNKYDYLGWFQPYYNFDQFLYHHAQYPWARWDNVSPYWLPKLYEDLKGIFSGATQPNLPPSRQPGDYVLWQVGANTGIGLELGFGADYLDINVSKMPLEDFRQWARLYRRWQPDGEDPEPEPLTVEERLTRLETAVFG